MSMLLTAKAMSIKVGNPLRKLVLIKLADNANDQGMCFPSYQNIADVCEISKRSAINHIDALIEMGFVSKKERKNKDGSSSNIYFLHLDNQPTIKKKTKTFTGSKKAQDESLNGGITPNLTSAGNSLPLVQEIHYPSAGNSLPLSAGDAPITNHSFESVNEPNKYIDRDRIALAFEKFWLAGLPKIAKPKSLEKFKSAYKKFNLARDLPMSVDDFAEMLVKDIQNRLSLGQFGFNQLHPTTYLNQQRWEDDVIAPSATNGSRGGARNPHDTSGAWAVGRTITVKEEVLNG